MAKNQPRRKIRSSSRREWKGYSQRMVKDFIQISLTCFVLVASCRAVDPTPKPWPVQFHAQLFQNTSAGKLAVVDLWYDWVNGRNYNIIQKQLGVKLWDVEWNNGTSYYFDLDHQTCKRILFPVGLLRPDWLDNAHYLGVRMLDGFTCNVWEKVDFITYYEDVETQRPMGWLFAKGMFVHVITFEEGAVLSDPNWQAPSYCFTPEMEHQEFTDSPLILPRQWSIPPQEPSIRWLRSLSS